MKGDPDAPSAPAYPMPNDEETGSITGSIEGEHCDDPKERINTYPPGFTYSLQSSQAQLAGKATAGRSKELGEVMLLGVGGLGCLAGIPD